MKSTQQSVPTERDRPRNLRFSMCVGFCERNYVGSVATQSPHEVHTFGWTVLEEPKSPTSFLPRRCMTTEDARQYAPEHSISKAGDFLNPWEAISRAFELHLEVSHCDPPWVPLLPQEEEAVEHRGEPPQCVNPPELDHRLQRPFAHAFASAETQHLQDLVIEQYQTGTVNVISFGHKGRYIGKRTLEVDDQQRGNWRRLLREQWFDYDDGSCFEIYSVVPPPVTDSSTVTVIVQLADIPAGQACTLIQFIPTDGLPEQPYVELVPMRAMRSTVFQACGQHLASESTAVIKQGHALWMTGEVHLLRHGTYLRILIDDPGDDEVLLTCRPNADITLDFDDFIPLPEGGRIIPPPNWNEHPLLRFATDNDAVYRNRQGFLTADCRTWLLPHGGRGHQQPRYIQIRAQLLLHLAERIRHLWRGCTPHPACSPITFG